MGAANSRENGGEALPRSPLNIICNTIVKILISNMCLGKKSGSVNSVQESSKAYCGFAHWGQSSTDQIMDLFTLKGT